MVEKLSHGRNIRDVMVIAAINDIASLHLLEFCIVRSTIKKCVSEIFVIP